MSAVRTVLGDVGPERLGVCDAHDHLFFGSPQLPGQELRDVSAARAELAAFRALGGDSVVQWTPYGLGRRVADLPPLSRETGVLVVAATGLHQAVHYDDRTLKELRGRLAGVFVAELADGIGTSGVRGGRGAPRDRCADRGPSGAGHRRARRTGPAVRRVGGGAAPGDPGPSEPLPDLVAHRQAAASGCYLAFDGPSRANHATDWRMPDAVRALAEAGHGDRLLLGGDTTTAAARSVNGGPGMPYLLRRVRPRLAAELGAELVDRIMGENPGRAFAVEWR